MAADPRSPTLHGVTATVNSAGPWVLALDLGSSSVRAQLYDARGVAFSDGAAARIRYAWDADEPGTMAIDAEGLLERTAAVVDETLARARAGGIEIAAVATAAFWHGMVGLGEDSVPVTPLFGWGDTRARAAAGRLSRLLDAADFHQRTGCFPHSSYPVAKLAWLREEVPEAFAAGRRWVSFPELLGIRWFGDPRVSLSIASGSGLLNLHRGCWDDAVLQTVGVREDQLSPIGDEPLCGLQPSLARRWPELAAVPWYRALGDGACANLGSGAAGPGTLGLTVGTSAAVRTVWEPAALRVPDHLWCYHVDRRRAVAGLALSNGGNAMAWLRGTLRLPDPVELERVLVAERPDGHGLTVLPSLLGERAPALDSGPAGALVGLSAASTPVQVVRAWLEAAAFRIADAVEAVARELHSPGAVIASGGALQHSAAWTQIVTDALGTSLVLTAADEATARGAALVALERLGEIRDLGNLPPPEGRRFVPDPDAHARYAAARERQRTLAQAVSTVHEPSPSER